MTYKTPGVYVEEIPLLPPSVAEVETAIPAFIGYTEFAKKDGLAIDGPFKINSLKEYEDYFGKAPGVNELVKLKVTKENKIEVVHLNVDDTKPEKGVKVPLSILYYAVQMFYINGGGPCYIVSVGEAKGEAPKKADLENGIAKIRNFDEPTLLVAPEAVFLSPADYKSFYEGAVTQAFQLKDRFVIIDTIYNPKPDLNTDQETFRNGKEKDENGNEISTAITLDKTLFRYSAAYYPWIKTSIGLWVDTEDQTKPKDFDKVVFTDDSETLKPDGTVQHLNGQKAGAIQSSFNNLYQQCKAEFERNMRAVLPPSSTIAGVYAYVDNTRGVWKAPANVVLKSVLAPTVQISLEEQRDLNVDPTGGKSINAIRSISGLGIAVWGARTMDGNDKEWRYVNVRRFFNMVEESVQKSTLWAVFEPNTKNTWVKVKGMIESYLMTKWIEGALAGSKPEEAFFVKVGLPETMTADDILEGRMIVKIGMAVSRPAEFIILQFTHKQQTS